MRGCLTGVRATDVLAAHEVVDRGFTWAACLPRLRRCPETSKTPARGPGESTVSGFRPSTVELDDGARLCVQTIGDPTDPALLLIGGATWSMDWWEDELCRRIAERGRMVIRYDARDTGRSTSYPAGAPGYRASDLTTDVVAVLDHLGIAQAHVAGLSMGGGIAQSLALEHRSRVASLTLIATSPIDPEIRGLPSPTAQVSSSASAGAREPDWTDRDAAIDAIVEGERPYAGPGNFDESQVRATAARVVDRTNDIAASMTNHFLVSDEEPSDDEPDDAASSDDGPADLSLGRLRGLPTLVLHGTADPLFPPAHGKALAEAIPGARLVELTDMGHQLPPRDTWELVVDLIIQHTAP
ncbi:pimeloyl-ACP methyl ester carboxylesterase [Nesterenkonia sandarakina]|uniref:Pimeloyl-ACP methyl ester carboxylesterase n=1 Tax=Nesterenkonia sandarakina TaxID=272918 RepID=A0A2T0YEG3_9MICC|nr:pimeloyl-ACP methyl ester carboxylesterase [Nesterenkonia sandarakina]